MPALLEGIELSKRFGTFSALDQVSFVLQPGEVLGLIGRSGAGKSVLADILAGLSAPSSGEIFIDGRAALSPLRAQHVGITVLPQQPLMAERLDVTENIFLGSELGHYRRMGWFRIPDRRRMDAMALELLAQLEMPIESLRTQVNQLSSEQRQLVALARAMVSPSRLVFLDEPTASLSYGYRQRLLALIHRWQQQGVAVILASTGLDQIFAVADRIMVLNEGRKVLDARTDLISREQVVGALIGQSERQQLTPMIWALENYYSAREQSERLRHQQRRLERDLVVQDTLNQELIRELAKQVKSLDQANIALQDAQRRLLTEREDERKFLARELHDQVIQDLLSVNFQLEELAGDLDQNRSGIDELEDIRSTVRGLVTDLRQICGNLRPPTIDSFGLGAALQSYTRDWSLRSGITVEFCGEAELGRLPEEIELSIFRIVQEGLSNVRKHAQASLVQVRLTSSSPRTLLLSIIDNGRGFDPQVDLASLAQAGHYGLLGISERVALLQGRLRFYRGSEGGFAVDAEIPHPRIMSDPQSYSA